MVNTFIALEIVVICMIFIALRLLLNGEGSREHKLIAYFLCSSLIHNLGYIFELTAPTIEAAKLAVKIENLGSGFIPLCYCFFICEYCYIKAPSKLLRIIEITIFISLPLVMTFERHNLYYTSMEWLSTQDGHHYLSIKYGILYYPLLVIKIIIPFIISFYTLCHVIFTRKDAQLKRQYITMLVISIIPLISMLSYILKLTKVFDTSPLSLGISLSIVEIILWRRRNYDFRSLAAQTVLQNMEDGVITLDEQKRLISYNNAASQIFSGLNRQNIGGNVFENDIIPAELFNTGTVAEAELNNRYYESYSKEITGKKKKMQGYVMVIHDVTNTRRYIEEIKLVRIQAEKANIAKSEFLANMSHEIRTPMNAILGFSEIIIEESKEPQIHSYASDIRASAGNLLTIINDILDLSKVEAGKMELVLSDYCMKKLLNDVVSMIKMAAASKNIRMECDISGNIHGCYNGDEGRIRQILINLLNNAVKFTNEGYVRLSVRSMPAKARDEEILIFKIEDSGIGIHEEDLEKIFESFKQVDSKFNRAVEGTGLGLSIVKHLVTLMNGSIRVESTFGKGTLFTVMVPQTKIDIHNFEENEKQNNEKYINNINTKKFKVLIVDDNMVNRKVAIGFMKSFGFEITEAGSGQESINLVKNNKYDIIFMDHMMPVMDGMEAVRIIRDECGENGKSPVIIALTANAMEGEKEKYINNGFQDYIPKPIQRKELNKVILKWLPKEYINKTIEGNEGSNNTGLASLDIQGIDVDAVMKYCSGDIESYRKILSLYCLEAEHKLKLLDELVISGDINNYMIEVHGLKSASASIGAMELSGFAREHEYAAKRNDRDYINKEFNNLIDKYKTQVDNIREYLRVNGSSGNTDQITHEIDMETLEKKLAAALDKLENFHSSECAGIIDDLLTLRLQAHILESLTEIRNKLSLYEDDDAEILIHNLIQSLHE